MDWLEVVNCIMLPSAGEIAIKLAMFSHTQYHTKTTQIKINTHKIGWP